MENTKEISVFIDESGSFDRDDLTSRYYLICMVFHDQSVDLTALFEKFNEELRDIGLGESHCIHAGPLIRREQDYRNMTREERRFIFSKMLAFARKAEFSYRCFHVDKRFTSTTETMHDALLQQILGFLVTHAQTLNAYEKLKIFYDNGQAQVTTILKEAFAPFASKTEFIPEVSPSRYRLFQLADILCTLELAQLKLQTGNRLTESEIAFFGSIQNLRKTYIKPLARFSTIAFTRPTIASICAAISRCSGSGGRIINSFLNSSSGNA